MVFFSLFLFRLFPLTTTSDIIKPQLSRILNSMSKRKLCTRCERPVKTCICDCLVEVSSNYQVIILQDKKEAKHALSSAPILARSIKGARIIIGEEFDPVELLGDKWQEESLLVFPKEKTLHSQQARNKNFRYLILLDGTWKKVARLIHQNPWLNALACISLDANFTSEYKIRKSPRADGLSTIEAAVTVLNQLDSNQDFSAILPAFRKMIDFQIQAMGEETFNKNYSG